jgi:hypothetical protein
MDYGVSSKAWGRGRVKDFDTKALIYDDDDDDDIYFRLQHGKGYHKCEKDYNMG